MPEFPDVEVYVTALEERVLGEPLEEIRLRSVSLVRTYDPPLKTLEGKLVRGLERLGKRIVFRFDPDLFIVIHLMIAGRFQWKQRGFAVPKKRAHGAFDFPAGTLLLTEASTRKRASLHVVRGREALAEHDRGGIELPGSTVDSFRAALTRRNHTLKRALTDPSILSGIGNAYSDEILHRARLSPVKLTEQLGDDEIERLHGACNDVLLEWRDRLEREREGGFPAKVTAFRPQMAVHGKYREPCPVCGAAVQRIAYAKREVNYCAKCQTGGKLLADRQLSRLLKADWPKTLEELEERGRA